MVLLTSRSEIFISRTYVTPRTATSQHEARSPVSVPSFAGRDFDTKLLMELPASADRCGENGEFHTFVYDAPVFSNALSVDTGEIVERDGFVFADVCAAR